eukprot:s6979_g2.t1
MAIYGLEVGGHPVEQESQLRHSVAEALGARRSDACRDVFYTLCCDGARLDPHQIRAIHTLFRARSFLLRCPDVHTLWGELWISRAGASFRGRFGLAAQVQRACDMLGFQWAHAFKLQSDSEVFPLLTCCMQFFRDICLYARMSVLLRALRRPGFQGLSWHVDFRACSLFLTGSHLANRGPSQYDKGVTFPLTESERLSVWVDGSAVDHLDHRITRTGSGIFFACDSPCNLSFPILGPVQTAYRAELAALAAVLCSADRPLRVHSDCQDVVDHFNHFTHEGFLDCPGTDIWLLILPIIRSRPPVFFQVVKVKGHASTTDVDKGFVSVSDKIGNDGAHALALAAAQARRFPFSDRSALQEHDALAFEVRKCMTAVVVARNKESERLGIYAPRRHSTTGGGSEADEAGQDAPCNDSSAPARFDISQSADQARRLKRKAAQNALAGVERSTHDSDGLPLNEAGRFLHVVYRKSGTFGARITLRGAQKLPSLWNSKAGGLATIAAQPHRTQDIFHDNPAFELGRCSHTFVPIGIGNRGLHIFNVYGYVGAGPRNPHAFKLNEQLLHDVCQIALSLIAGDLQTAPDQSPLLGTLIQSGRLFDLGALFTESTWTFQKGDNQHIRTRTQHCPLRLVMLLVANIVAVALPPRLKIQHPPHAGSEAFVQMEKIVTNITSTWRRLFHEDVTLSIPPADQQVLPLLKHAESALTTEQEQLQHQRINTFKEYLIKDWNDTRKATYTWLRNREPFVPPCFKASNDNEFVTRHQQLHAMMLDDWRPIFNRYVERNPPDFQAFLATFPHCLPDNFQYSDTHPLHLTDIALTDVKHIIKELKPSAPGSDAWHVHELKLLGDESLTRLVQFYNLVEATAKWPTAMQEVPVQHMMVEIIKARKVAEPLEPPDDFDPSQFARKPTSAQPDSSLPSSSTSKQPSDFKFHKVAPDHSKPKTDENGLLLPASLRPGGSRFQYVQKKKDTYRAIIPLGAKRHSIGPFSSEEDAARAVKDFLERWDAGVAPTTRGSKREDKHTKNIQLQLDQLNIHAKKEGRHCILDAAAPTCAFCNQSVQRYYILQFAKKQCHAISNKVDSRGSATRAEKLSQTRSAQLQSDVDEHNKQAVTRGRHYIVDIFQPSCFYCKQKVSKNYLRTWMKKDCKFKHD